MWTWRSNRNPGYQKIADKLKLSYSEIDVDKLIFFACKVFRLFKSGGSRKVKYILMGQSSRKERVYLFEYSYVVSTGKSSTTISQHVCLAEPAIPIPIFSVKPQNVLDNIGKWFGMQDIEFVKYADFNKNYLVKAQNPEELEKFFKTDILGYLSFEKGWSVESDGTKLIFYKLGKLMNEEMVEPFFQASTTLYELFMGYLSISEMDSVPSFKKKK